MNNFAETVASGEVVFAAEELFGKSQGVGVGKIVAAAEADGHGLALAMLLEESDRRTNQAWQGVAGVDQAEELDGEFALLLPTQRLRARTGLN